jgi:hypothetical protein
VRHVMCAPHFSCLLQYREERERERATRTTVAVSYTRANGASILPVVPACLPACLCRLDILSLLAATSRCKYQNNKQTGRTAGRSLHLSVHPSVRPSGSRRRFPYENTSTNEFIIRHSPVVCLLLYAAVACVRVYIPSCVW